VAQPDPAVWFLPFTSSDPTASDGDGRPWADGTEMAARARPTATGGPRNPWDENCKVKTFVGGLAAMSAIRDSLEHAITEAKAARAAGAVPGKLGRVYLTGWRFNCLRDLSETNPWGAGPWTAYLSGNQAMADQTAIGLVLRLMQAGVIVRILLWYPAAISGPFPAKFDAHIEDHHYAAELVAAENARLMGEAKPPNTEDLGVVALDMRTAATVFATHHQKTVVIRGASTSVAYVGGVDLAYTRRDAQLGDWQSGAGIPDPAVGWSWPKDNTTNYSTVAAVPPVSHRQESDLPVNVYGDGDPTSPLNRQIWHDQHLRLEGPIVGTLEWQFKERWEDTTRGRLFDVRDPYGKTNWALGQVIFSTAAAFDATGVKALPLPAAASDVKGSATRVQMWRTIPWRTTRSGPPFQRAEFTVMAGIANAVKRARELIWIFDQYFWSRPLASLLNAQLHANPSLRVIVILPPHADTQVAAAHRARALALGGLTKKLSKTGADYDQVAVYNLWLDRRKAAVGTSRSRGIYVHAKAHTYDDGLLVCGSANLNRRSFTCDSEIACAVLDPAVVLDHQTQLWAYLFNEATRPSIDLSVGGSGKQLFDRFREAANMESAKPPILIRDPWEDPNPTLPNNVVRDQSPRFFGSQYDYVLDPSSITTNVEKDTRDATGALRDARLDEIVSRIERVHVGDNWPWRRP
jgi:phosphatidylserine/phosphatidylglycerophosphate/cardiolipin synthase-like enzyme